MNIFDCTVGDIYGDSITLNIEIETEDDILYVDATIGISVDYIDDEDVEFDYVGDVEFDDEDLSEEVKNLINDNFDNLVCKNNNEISDKLREIFTEDKGCREYDDFDYERAEHEYCWSHDLA